jgi:hypothetical protein
VAEFKKGTDVFNDDNRTKAFSYCYQLMTIEQPSRKEAVAFLLSTKYVQFVRASRTSAGGIEYSNTDHQPLLYDAATPIEDTPIGLWWLYSFFSACPGELGYERVCNPFQSTHQHSSLLGHGISSKVYAVYKEPKLIGAWNDMLPESWRKLETLATRLDYEGLRDGFAELCPCAADVNG